MALKSEIRQFIAENFIVEEASIADDISLTHSGIIDSLGVLELVHFLESRYGVRVREAETLPENLDTVNNIARYLGTKLGTGLGAEPGTEPGTEVPSLDPETAAA